MAEQPDDHTLRYLHRLPLVLAPLPTLSSFASKAVFTHLKSPQDQSLWTKCTSCRAELVGGVNAAYWNANGALWATCGGCGATSRRPDEAAAGAETLEERTTGRGQFASARKRRRVEEKRRREAVHPTAMRAAVTVAKSGREPSSSAVAKSKASVNATARPSNVFSLSSSSSSRPSPQPSLPPLPSKQPKGATPSLPPSLTASPAPSRPPSTASSSSSSARPSPKPPASSAASPAPSASSTKSASTSDAASAKKRKRGKPGGLAEMLEAKKKKEREAAGGGAGLMDFLQGL
ncbi:hypothetical protein JCM10207_002456 [Rhodosporidiobolus poonsookiae]